MTYNKLTDEEAAVILHKGTEWPGSGIYNEHFYNGIYVCRQCDTPLYSSTAKFHSHCGWPSFDAELPGRVLHQPDADGHRVEILCQTCGGHLGHVFVGEMYTAANTRHCVNSLSLRFIPFDDLFAKAKQGSDQLELAIVAGGCFWGVEHLFAKIPGVLACEVGYSGGHLDNPTYEQVCSGTSGHAEALCVIFDKTLTDYETMIKAFFEIHDPTQSMRQGPDIGSQYRSAIFYLNDEQKKIAESVRDILRRSGFAVVTQITEFTHFWPAERYHQQYYAKQGGQPYCHMRVKRFD